MQTVQGRSTTVLARSMGRLKESRSRNTFKMERWWAIGVSTVLNRVSEASYVLGSETA